MTKKQLSGSGIPYGSAVYSVHILWRDRRIGPLRVARVACVSARRSILSRSKSKARIIDDKYPHGISDAVRGACFDDQQFGRVCNVAFDRAIDPEKRRGLPQLSTRSRPFVRPKE
jgi:hypothetical protein